MPHDAEGTPSIWYNSARPGLQATPSIDLLTSLSSAATGPFNGQNYVFTLKVRPTIRPSDDLNIADEFPLAGSATFALVYL